MSAMLIFTMVNVNRANIYKSGRELCAADQQRSGGW